MQLLTLADLKFKARYKLWLLWIVQEPNKCHFKKESRCTSQGGNHMQSFFFFLRGNSISLKGEGYKKGRRNNRVPETAQEQRLQDPKQSKHWKILAQLQLIPFDSTFWFWI